MKPGPKPRPYSPPAYIATAFAELKAGATNVEAAKAAGVTENTLLRHIRLCEANNLPVVFSRRGRRSSARLVFDPKKPVRLRTPRWLGEAFEILRAGGTYEEAATLAGVKRNALIRYLRLAEQRGIPVVRSVRTRKASVR